MAFMIQVITGGRPMQMSADNSMDEDRVKIGYARVSTGDQTLDLQLDALIAAGVDRNRIYTDTASGKRDDRPGLAECLKALRQGDVLIVWKLDRLGRSLPHLVSTVTDLERRGIGFKVLTGQGASIDTSTANGRLMFAIFSAFAEFERDLIAERTRAGLSAARARGRVGGRRRSLSVAQLRIAQAAMASRETSVKELAAQLKVSAATLYSYISPTGELRPAGRALIAGGNSS